MPRVHDARRHYLPFTQWPLPDQAAWLALFRPASPLDEGGSCAHWASVSIKKRLLTYGHWLTFLSLRRPDLIGRAQCDGVRYFTGGIGVNIHAGSRG
jgi:hypothetical protein